LAGQRRAGAGQLCWGLFQKIVVADHLFAPAADAVYGAGRPVPTADAWLATLAFAGQIFCDFAGYSTCAIGIALCLGFHLPDNFHRPYAACGFGDFWRRWHITLSTWLRDHCYIPLGGSRRVALRTLVNLVVVMGLGGLWHGAAWTFVIWGLLHGVYLVVEHGLRRAARGAAWTRHAATRWAGIAATFVLVLVAWVPFRADSFGSVMLTWLAMAGKDFGTPYALPGRDVATVLVAATALLASHWWLRGRRSEDVVARTPWPAVAGIWAFMLIVLCFAQGGGDAFIYFQF